MKARSVVKIGNSYYVSLPKKWVLTHELDRGAQVYVKPRNDGVIEIVPSISTGTKPLTKRIQLTKFVEREIFSAYLAGYDVIIIEDVGSKLREAPLSQVLDRIQHLLVGLEVVEERGDRVVLQCFIREDYEIGQIIVRMDALARSMYLDAMKSLLTDDQELARSVIKRDDRLDRLYFLTVRLLRKLVGKPTLDLDKKVRLLDYRLLVRELEEIGDMAEEIVCKKKELKVDENALKVAKSIAELEKELIHTIVKSTSCSKFNPLVLTNLKDKIKAKASSYSVYSYLVGIIRKLEDIADLLS